MICEYFFAFFSLHESEKISFSLLIHVIFWFHSCVTLGTLLYKKIYFLIFFLYIYLLRSILPFRIQYFIFPCFLIHWFLHHPPTDIFPSFLLAFNWFQLHFSGGGIIEADKHFFCSGVGWSRAPPRCHSG